MLHRSPNVQQVPLRSRAAQRTKNADENATSKLRQTSSIIAAATRSTIHATKTGVAARRPVLNEVTTSAVNRKVLPLLPVLHCPLIRAYIRVPLGSLEERASPQRLSGSGLAPLPLSSMQVFRNANLLFQHPAFQFLNHIQGPSAHLVSNVQPLSSMFLQKTYQVLPLLWRILSKYMPPTVKTAWTLRSLRRRSKP